jgi:hypothetical protein
MSRRSDVMALPTGIARRHVIAKVKRFTLIIRAVLRPTIYF